METTKKMMRSVLFDLQRLQREAYDKGLNLQIGVRGCDTSTPWIMGNVSQEECSFVEDAEGTTYINFHFHSYYDFYSKEENLTSWREELSKVEKFIENYEN